MKNSSTKSLLFAALVLTGCGHPAAEAEFSAGLPTQDMVEMKTPGTAGQALASAEAVRTLGRGDTSEYYRVTRSTTEAVNSSTLAVLDLVHRVVQYPPTSVSEDTAVWGPHSEALQMNAWRLTVTRTSDTTYRYALAAKDKTAADSTFVDLLTGTHTVVRDAQGEVQRGLGQGEFTLDWERSRKLPDDDKNNTGSITVRYAHPSAQGPAQVDATFQGVTDKDSGKPVGAFYAYKAQPGQGGEFDFKISRDAYQPSGKASDEETLTIKSRWMESGAGRSDIKVSGGDLAARPAMVNECWSTSFASQYLKNSYDSSRNYGTEATDCVFPSAVYSSL